MIDWARVDELRSEVGDEGFAEIFELFLDEVETVVVRLQSAPDPRSLESDMHFLKGGAWNLGFADFGGMCQDGERKAAAGRPEEVDVPRIVESYFTSKTRFLAGREGGSHSSAA